MSTAVMTETTGKVRQLEFDWEPVENHRPAGKLDQRAVRSSATNTPPRPRGQRNSVEFGTKKQGDESSGRLAGTGSPRQISRSDRVELASADRRRQARPSPCSILPSKIVDRDLHQRQPDSEFEQQTSGATLERPKKPAEQSSPRKCQPVRIGTLFMELLKRYGITEEEIQEYTAAM